MQNNKLLVLFVCTANVCRSQMAEGWANHLKADEMYAFSAGIAKGWAVSNSAVETMRAEGVDISGQYTKNIEELSGIEFDYVITLSDEAKEYCPKFGLGTKVLHMPIEDPSSFLGTAGQIRGAFAETSRKIKALVEKMPKSLQTKDGNN